MTSAENSSKPTALYRLFDASGTLLYVGYTYDPERRFREHSKEKPWWPEVSQPPQLEWHDDAILAEKAETIAIALERPRHNIDPQDAPVQPDPVAFGAKPARIVGILRAEIIAGKYGDSGPHVPSRTMIAKRFGVSAESGSVVLRRLAAEGWVTLDQGRGSFLRPRRLFDVWVEVPRPDHRAVDRQALLKAVDAGTGGNAAVKRVRSVRVDDEAARVTIGVTATSAGIAGEIAETLVWSAPGWSWDGWDLAGASVTARPA